MTIKEAADSLYKKGSITQEECELIKEAAFSDLAKGLKSVKPRDILSGVAIAGISLAALKQLMSPLIDTVKAKQSYKLMAEKYPALKEKDPDQVKDYFNVIKTFSPKAATNPLVAGALVNKMIEFGGVDHKLVQDISSIQNAMPVMNALGDISGAATKSLFLNKPGLPPTEVTTRAGDISTKEFHFPESGD